MIRRASPGARKVALFAAILGGVGALAFTFVFAIGGADDADKYGRIKLPGKGQIELPKGKVALYYEEQIELDENESLDLPDGLRVVARREVTVRSEKVVQNAVNLDNRSLREFAKLEIPQAGRYRVTVRSSTSGSNRPAITFGKGQLEGIGRGAAIGGAILGAGLLVALASLLIGRRGYTPPPASFPVPAGASPGAFGTAAPMSSGSASPVASGPPVPGTAPAPVTPPGPAPPASAAPAPTAPIQPGADPVEVQLRELERRHAAGALSDEDYAAQRKRVIDAAFGR